MEKYGLDALIAATPENVTYFSEHRSMTQRYFKSDTFTLVPRDPLPKPVLIIPKIDIGTLVMSPPVVQDVRFYGRLQLVPNRKATLTSTDIRAARYLRNVWPKMKTDAVETLVTAIRDYGLSSSTIGLDNEGLSTSSCEKLRDLLPKVKFISASSMMKEIRMIKSSDEVRAIRKATSIVEAAIQVGLESASSKISERELARTVLSTIVERGEPYFVNVYFGRNSAYVLRPHLNLRIKPGEQIWIDAGCYCENFCSDTGITAVLGKSSAKLSKYHNAILNGQRRAIQAIKPGVRASDLHRIAASETKKGIPWFEREQVGHGIGMEHYEPPRISAYNETSLEAGMVINIETPYYEIGLGGLIVEDTVLVTKRGYELLTKLSKELYEI